jgi:glycosyltransferase involved in cell wall biosynthesis
MSQCDLLIVGDGPERENLERLVAEYNLQMRVHFTGSLSHEAVIAALKTADLFVLNSIYEGLPHVLLEALAVGLPIVATRIGGTPEVVVDGVNGRLTPISNIPQLTQTIQEAVGNLDQFDVTLPPQFKLETMLDQTIELLLHTGDQDH